VTDTQLLPVIWVLASMVIAVLVTLAFSPARAAYFRLTAGGRVAEQVGRLVYFVGLPYAALLAKSLSPIDLGMAGNTGPILGWSSVDWLNQLNNALVIGLFALIPIGLAARQMARGGQPLGVDVRSTGATLLDAAYAEIHWAFYRAAPYIILRDVYAATLLGLGLVSVELLVALVRNGPGQRSEDRQSWLGQALLLAMSATVFIITRNVWLALVLHLVFELAIRLWSTRLADRALGRPPARSSVYPDRDSALPGLEAGDGPPGISIDQQNKAAH
jgi:hypothetical protein